MSWRIKPSQRSSKDYFRPCFFADLWQVSRAFFRTRSALGRLLCHFVRFTDMAVGSLAYLACPIRRRLTRRKLILLLAVVGLPLLATGCLCLSFGGGCGNPSAHQETDGVLAQKGEVRCGPDTPVVVYYPVPYASPPNLETHDHFHQWTILEQKADCFRVVQNSPGPPMNWTARGVRAAGATPLENSTVTSAPAASSEPLPILPTNFSR